jgi:predicted nucleic acid-binding protein
MDLVVDASAAIALVAGEERATLVADVIGARRRSGAEILVPNHFWLEVVNALAIGYRASAALVVEAIAELDATGIQTVALDRPHVLLVIDAIDRHRLTAYDAAYLALAESSEADLLTFDASLAAAAGPRLIPFDGDESIRETPAGYAGLETRPGWAAWPGAAAYLRELRKTIRTPNAET